MNLEEDNDGTKRNGVSNSGMGKRYWEFSANEIQALGIRLNVQNKITSDETGEIQCSK